MPSSLSTSVSEYSSIVNSLSRSATSNALYSKSSNVCGVEYISLPFPFFDLIITKSLSTSKSLLQSTEFNIPRNASTSFFFNCTLSFIISPPQIARDLLSIDSILGLISFVKSEFQKTFLFQNMKSWCKITVIVLKPVPFQISSIRKRHCPLHNTKSCIM